VRGPRTLVVGVEVQLNVGEVEIDLEQSPFGAEPRRPVRDADAVEVARSLDKRAAVTKAIAQDRVDVISRGLVIKAHDQNSATPVEQPRTVNVTPAAWRPSEGTR
jgi:hypothetical protein